MLAQFNKRKVMTLFNLKRKFTEVLKILSSISLRLSKETLAKLKFNKKINSNKKSYIQASKSNMEDIIYIKDVFSKLPTKKVIETNNIINSKISQAKSKINITTKDLSRKQIIISISKNNFVNFYISNINRCLKEVKSNTITNFI